MVPVEPPAPAGGPGMPTPLHPGASHCARPAPTGRSAGGRGRLARHGARAGAHPRRLAAALAAGEVLGRGGRRGGADADRAGRRGAGAQHPGDGGHLAGDRGRAGPGRALAATAADAARRGRRGDLPGGAAFRRALRGAARAAAGPPDLRPRTAPARLRRPARPAGRRDRPVRTRAQRGRDGEGLRGRPAVEDRQLVRHHPRGRRPGRLGPLQPVHGGDAVDLLPGLAAEPATLGRAAVPAGPPGAGRATAGPVGQQDRRLRLRQPDHLGGLRGAGHATRR